MAISQFPPPPIEVSNFPASFGISDGPNLDAFSRLRVSTPVGLFDSSFQYDLQPLLYYTVTANSGTVTHTAAYSSAKLSTAAVASSSALLQSKQYHRYIPAKSQLVVMTQIMGAAVAGITRRAGYFDDNDGVFLEQNGITDVALVRRTSTSGSPVDNRVVQASWNLDPLNGAGPSGITLDLSKASILVIDLQWLGMGRIRVGFDIGGIIVYVHEFLNANVLTVPYMKTANLPVRWSASGNGVSDMYATCAAVISEGGTEFDRGLCTQLARLSSVRAARSLIGASYLRSLAELSQQVVVCVHLLSVSVPQPPITQSLTGSKSTQRALQGLFLAITQYCGRLSTIQQLRVEPGFQRGPPPQ